MVVQPVSEPTNNPAAVSPKILLSSLQSGWEGLKTVGPLGLLNIAGDIRSAERGSKTIKRKALEEINRRAKRKLNIFGELIPPI